MTFHSSGNRRKQLYATTMSPVKLLFLLEIIALFVKKLSQIIGDARFSLQCEEPSPGIWEKCINWLGISEKSNVCLTTEEITHNTARALLGALFACLFAEIVRTVICYFILKEGRIEVFMPEENFRGEQFANWGFALRRNPNIIVYTRSVVSQEEYLVRTVNMLTTTTVTYNVHTGRVHSWCRPRLFVY